MLNLGDNKFLVECANDLPDMSHARELFLDFETASFDPVRYGNTPWKGHKICGTCVTRDNDPRCYYIPTRHYFVTGERHPANLDEDAVARWLRDSVSTCDDWVNHNVKFDAHFAASEGARFRGRLVDTLTLAKVHDSDRMFKGGYGLDALSATWLENDISAHEQKLKAHIASIKLPRNRKAKDYGLAPPDVMAAYGAQDVRTARELYRWLQTHRHADHEALWDTEIKLTPVLFDMESDGMRVDPQQLDIEELKTLYEMSRLEEELEKVVGEPINPASAKDCFNLICTYLALPILAYNESGNPSFDKHALGEYANLPEVKDNARSTRIVDLVRRYRKRHTLLTFFIQPYKDHQVDGIMHPEYNQAVRSGRMSCKRPNAQQLSKEAKALILPRAGEAILSCDYSQVEFRLIVHYIRDTAAINAYNEDADTDFHQWVAGMCGIPRGPAKNVNFAIGYGAGERKVVSMLAGNDDLTAKFHGLIEESVLSGEVREDQRLDVLKAMCRRRGKEVFELYHDTLPGIRITSRAAAAKVSRQGHVKNAYGRHVHLPTKAAHIAFNRIVQGCAADIVKERMVAVSPRYNAQTRVDGLRISVNVHDEIKFVGPRDATRDPRVVARIVNTLEDTSYKFRVPIRMGAGWSDINWAVAASDDAILDVDRSLVSNTPA